MRQKGSVPLAVLIGLAVVILVVMGLAVCTDALFEDEDERNDLGAPTLVLPEGDRSVSAKVLSHPLGHSDRDDDRDYSGSKNKGRESRGDCDRARNCSDDDFSPSFDKSPVQDSFNVCLPGATCHWGDGAEGDGEQAAGLPSNLDPRCAPYHCDPAPSTSSLFKLDPVLLIQTIQSGAQAIGEAAGTMAGAIAAFPIGILL